VISQGLISGGETTRADELSQSGRVTLAGKTTFLHINTVVGLPNRDNSWRSECQESLD